MLISKSRYTEKFQTHRGANFIFVFSIFKYDIYVAKFCISRKTVNTVLSPHTDFLKPIFEETIVYIGIIETFFLFFTRRKI